MRRCKKHNTDPSSIIGICASCLRDRLFKIILAQEQAQAQSLRDTSIYASSYLSRQNTAAPVIKQYNNNNNNNNNNNKHRLNYSLSDQQRFYNSPQIAIHTGGCIGSSSSSMKKNGNSLIKFSSFSNLFKSKSSNGNGYVNASSTSSGGVANRKVCVSDRGMSPVRLSTDVELSDYETCKQTPVKTPSRRGGGGGSRSVSELIFCLSPLVRASPNRLKSRSAMTTVDGGENGGPVVVPHLRYTKSFYGNRSRKLADFGRPDRV